MVLPQPKQDDNLGDWFKIAENRTKKESAQCSFPRLRIVSRMYLFRM